MSDQPDPGTEKIIVNEDWKSQVEAEKEAARQAAERPDGGPSEPTEPALPPDFVTLAGTLYLQGMIFLGLLPSPGADKPEVHLPRAKHCVDTLEMLQEKTEGNRTPEETKEIERMLYELRMAFVEVRKGASP